MIDWIWIGFCLAAGIFLFVLFIRLWRVWLWLLCALVVVAATALVMHAYHIPLFPAAVPAVLLFGWWLNRNRGVA
jgi:hypothetical protein